MEYCFPQTPPHPFGWDAHPSQVTRSASCQVFLRVSWYPLCTPGWRRVLWGWSTLPKNIKQRPSKQQCLSLPLGIHHTNYQTTSFGDWVVKVIETKGVLPTPFVWGNVFYLHCVCLFCTYRAVGCIFGELLNNSPLFPVSIWHEVI